MTSSVSVIMSALNEPYVSKTVESVLQNSGDELSQIIVVDDASDQPISLRHDKTTVVRNTIRQGLIRARQRGTELSNSDIVVSLDPHIKVSPNWLESVIAKIDNNYKCVAVPETNGLNVDKWVSTGSHGTKSRWRWNLDFCWQYDDGCDDSPMFAGHCFAFSKQWWHETGGFDVGMDKWGGENIEFSLRSWLSGGSVEIARGSSVAHWFKTKWSYQMDGTTLLSNKARIAEVWLGDHKRSFYQAVNKLPGTIDFGDISDRLRIRDRIQTRTLDWYINKFNPDLFGVTKLRNKHFGANIAIVGANPIVDTYGMKRLREILSCFDVVIGVNYISLHVPCDYVIFHDLNPAQTVLESEKYKPHTLLVPVRLKNGSDLERSNPDSGWSIYELGGIDSDKPLKSKGPPFFHHASTAHTAAHIAAFMGAKSVTMVACDGSFSNNSHISIPEYRNGNYWPKNNKTQNYLDRMNRGYEMLQKAFAQWNVPLLKVGKL